LFEVDDPHIPFVEAIDLSNAYKEIENRTSDDQRIRKIHVKGAFAAAINTGAFFS
jgi:hypothetical protein